MFREYTQHQPNVVLFDRTDAGVAPYLGGFSSSAAYAQGQSERESDEDGKNDAKVQDFQLIRLGVDQLAKASANRLMEFGETPREATWSSAVERPVYVTNIQDMWFWIFMILNHSRSLGPRLFISPTSPIEAAPQFREAVLFKQEYLYLFEDDVKAAIAEEFGKTLSALPKVLARTTKRVWKHRQRESTSQRQIGDVDLPGQTLYFLRPDDVFYIPEEPVNHNGDSTLRQLTFEEVEALELGLKIKAGQLPRVDVEVDVSMRRSGFTPFWVRAHNGPLVIETDMPDPRPRNPRVAVTTSNLFD